MNNGKKILLTGAGGAALPFIIQRLKAKGYRVYAADMDKEAVGLLYADKGLVIPGGAAREFLPAMAEICRKEKIDAVVPLVDEELVPCFKLRQYGVSVILPTEKFTRMCLDKYALMRALKDAGVPVPQTALTGTGAGGLSFPIVAKPRSGRGSRGLGILRSTRELKNYFEHSPYAKKDILLQKLIEGVEFTVSVVVWRDGSVQAVIPKEIISKKGITRLAVTRRNAAIDLVCRKIQEKLSADGPFNVQLILEKKSGIPYVFEINPRFSSSVSLTMEAGVDEIGDILDQELLKKPGKKRNTWEEGVVLVRQSQECFMREKEFLSGTKKIAAYRGRKA